MSTKEMGEEEKKVKEFDNTLKRVLPDKYESKIGKNLLYELKINNNL